MTSAQALRSELIKEINSLPDEKLQKASELLRSLLDSNGTSPQQVQFPTGRDPLLDYIGGVSHGSLSAGIDEELYGE